MFELLAKAFTGGHGAAMLDKDSIAELLRTSPEALEAFESAYRKGAIDFGDKLNSRQAVEQRHAECGPALEGGVPESANELIDRIVAELVAQTSVYVYDGDEVAVLRNLPALPAGTQMVTKADIMAVPEKLRPQLSGNLMKVDIPGDTCMPLLFYYKKYLEERDPKLRRQHYHRFRQGLDILDLDPITYEILGRNQNSMGNWLPQLVDACRGGDGFFRIPATTIAKVPLPLLQLTRQEYGEMTPGTLTIVDKWAHEVFGLDDTKEYFVKTGTYSSKFDFRNAYVHGEQEVQELGEYLLYIHFQALMMASPLNTPCIYGVSTTNEWVVREFIHDKEGNPSIYKGLPLHTEYRVFVDCDTDEVLGIAPYWEPKTMKERFGHRQDADSPHQIHDYVIYKSHEGVLMERYAQHKDEVVSHIKKLLPGLNLQGQWSIDVMQNGDDFWLIDMAVAESSFFYKEYVPKALRRPMEEDWMPQLPAGETGGQKGGK